MGVLAFLAVFAFQQMNYSHHCLRAEGHENAPNTSLGLCVSVVKLGRTGQLVARPEGRAYRVCGD